MSLWRQLTRGTRALTDRAGADRDLADEVQQFLDHATAEKVAQGMDLDAARRAARLELGNATAVREQARSYGWENPVASFAADLRYAVRRLRATPGFTIVTVLTIAIGLGATTAIFSAVNPVLFEPLPYPQSGRIMTILESGRNGTRNDGTFGMYRGLVARDHLFDAFAVYKPWQPTLTGADQAERVSGQRVSATFFRVLGIAPAAGRDFTAADDQPNAANVLILSHAIWQRRFHADPAIVGKTITLADNPWTVIGVMPREFEDVLSPGAEFWAPLQYEMSQGSAWGHHLHTIGRLRPGVAVEQAGTEISALAHAVLADEKPETYGTDVEFRTTPLREEVTAAVRPALTVVLAAVLLLLVIASVNVTNLLLARGVQRRAEFAVRAALGASRTRLVRQVLAESMMLAVAGGVVGFAIAVVGVRALVALTPPGLPRAGAITIDATVFLFGLAITALVGVVCGLIPALHAAGGDPQLALQRGSRRSVGGHQRVRSVLVIAEVSLAFILLVGSGLLLRSLQRLFAVPAGFESSQLLTMQVQASGHRFDDDGTTLRFFDQLLASVRGVPGVVEAALTSQLPLSGDIEKYGVHFEPGQPNDPGEVSGTFRYAVTAQYLAAMRIPLRRGRMLDDGDRAGGPRVALISESMARRRMPGIDPVGHRFRIGDGLVYTVVGVVGDVKQQSLAIDEPDAVYIPSTQVRSADRGMSLVVRTRGAPASVAAAVRQAVWSVDKNVPIARVAAMDELVAATAAERRFMLLLFEVFALAALVLAAAGLYGVLSGSVAERTREIGVRSALGASRQQVVGLVVRQGLVLTGAGALVGLGGALVASRVIISMLFGISPLDIVTYVGVMLLLIAAAAVASWVPAWRAARVDPVITLRAE